MRALLPVMAGLCILLSCSGKDKLPRDVMPKERFEGIMWDMMQADQYLSDFVLYKDTSLDKQALHTNLYEEVFRLHNTNKEEFSRSFKYYRSRPSLMKQVLDTLNAKKTLDVQEAAKPVNINDSLLKNRTRAVPKAISVQ